MSTPATTNANGARTAPLHVALSTGGSLTSSTTPLSAPPAGRESPDATLAKNLVVARAITGVTQQELADAAGISRATVAQLETGYSDPRLSTIVDIAHALGISPLLLLIGHDEVRALSELPTALDHSGVTVPPAELDTMWRQVRSGLLKDRLRAAKLGAAVVRRGQPPEPTGNDASRNDASTNDPSPLPTVSAAVFTAILPGTGTVVGEAFGRLLARGQSALKS